MGISGDIRPRRHHTTLPAAHVFVPETKSEENALPVKAETPTNEVSTSTSPEVTNLSHSFFGDQAPEQTEEPIISGPSFWQRLFNRWTLATLILASIGILIYLNLDTVKGFLHITPPVTETASTETPSASTTETTVPAQNYTTTTTPAAATTPAAPDKSTITISVLNGNGIKGSADNVKVLLQNAGFTVANTGNAARFTYATTIIYYKTGKLTEANLVKDALTGRSLSTVLSDTIAKSYDIVVVVGKK